MPAIVEHFVVRIARAAHDSVSVIVSRHALLRDPMIFDRRFEHHAVGELVDHAALDLLPRRLARRVAVAAAAFPAPRGAARVRRRESECSPVPLLRSMRTRSPVLSSASPPPAAASGEALRIDGEPDVPDCRPSPMQGSEVMPCLISAAGGCMFTTSAEPG